MDTSYKYKYLKYKHKYLIAKEMYNQYGGLLNPSIKAFIKELPALQKAAEDRTDQSFQKISQEYMDALQLLNKEEDAYKKEVKKLDKEQKAKKEAEFNERGKELQANSEWKSFAAMKDIFYKMPNQSKWIMDNYKNSRITVSDIESNVFPLIINFLKLKIKDMPNTIEGVRAALNLNESREKLESVKIAEEAEQKAREGGQTRYDGSNIKIIELLTTEGACYYGKGTKWCTAYTDKPNRFKQHQSYGVMYTIQPKIRQTSNKNERYQLQFPRGSHVNDETMLEFKDDANEDIELVEVYKMYPELKFLSTLEDKFFNIVLFGAIAKEYRDVVEMILNDGADPNTLDSTKKTPLYNAVIKNNESIVQLLLDRGADINAVVQNEAIIHTAIRNRVSDAISVLLKDKNLDINVKDKDGNTPLHIAVDNSGTYGSIIPDLIKKGGDMGIKNNNGQTPMDLANDDVKQMLHR